MKNDRSLIKAYRRLAVIILFSVFAVAPVPAAAAEGEPTLAWNGGSNKVGAMELASARHSEIKDELNKLIAQAEALKPQPDLKERWRISPARSKRTVRILIFALIQAPAN